MTARFELGKLITSPGASRFCDKYDISIVDVLRRYLQGDWGNSSPFDKSKNNKVVETGDGQIFAAYHFLQGRLWIITDFGKRQTRVLTPEEY